MTSEVGTAKEPYFTVMGDRFRQDVPPINVRPVPTDVAAFVDDVNNDATVVKPIDDLYVGTHADGDGWLFVKLFAGQADPNKTSYEVLDQAMTAPFPAKIPDALIGYQPGVPPAPDPAPTHSVHIKGCNIGRDRLFDTKQPLCPYLSHLKEAFGSHVKLTAPKHYHSLQNLPPFKGTFEFMCHQLEVRTKDPFPDRAALIAGFKSAALHYYNGDPIPDADWDTLVPNKIPMKGATKNLYRTTLPLGRTIENQTTITVDREYRIEIEQFDFSVTPGAGNPIPPDKAGRLAALKATIAADDRFKDTHAWPYWERRRFNNFDDYMDGYDWTLSVNAHGDLVAVGRRYKYRIVEPIVDRSAAAPTPPPLIYNYYPAPGDPTPAITTGLDEADDKFFGRA